MVEQLPPPHTVEVAEDVFAYIQPDGSWWLNNTGFIVGDDNVVAIDATSTERRTRALLDAIRDVTTTPVRTLVNTHHHGDHTNGNCLFSDATVIGHRLCRDGVLAQVIGGNEAVFGDVEWGELTIRPPEVVFDDHLTLYVGDVRVELHHLGTAAHTTNDVVAWLPDKRVLFTGDLVFNGGTPFMLMGSVAGFLDAMPRLREFGAATLVPGHGPVCEPAAIDDGEHYAQFVLELAVEASDAGLAPLDAARQADLGEFSDLHDRERIVGNLHRAMAELDGLERGAAIDVPAAFGDMLAFHGGKLRCLA